MTSGNDSYADKQLKAQASALLNSLAPAGWLVAAEQPARNGAVRVTSPDSETRSIDVIPCDGLRPRDVVGLPDPTRPTVVAATWLSPRTRELLAARQIGYVDLSGNVYLSIDRPGLAIRAQGAQRNPSPEAAQGPNLRGPRAWALQRTLAEVLPPYGVTELAAAIKADAGYVSRLVGALSDELLTGRVGRGPIDKVDWEPLLRQMTSTYSLLNSNATTGWIASAGPEQFLKDVATQSEASFAITGSFAAAELTSVAPPEIAVVFVEDPELLASLTNLRPARNGGNVVTARPYDDLVFDRTWTRNGMTFASPAQVAVDCLTGPGRLPAQGEAMVEWLRTNAPTWQADSLTEQPGLP